MIYIKIPSHHLTALLFGSDKMMYLRVLHRMPGTECSPEYMWATKHCTRSVAAPTTQKNELLPLFVPQFLQ